MKQLAKLGALVVAVVSGATIVTCAQRRAEPKKALREVVVPGQAGGVLEPRQEPAALQEPAADRGDPGSNAAPRVTDPMFLPSSKSGLGGLGLRELDPGAPAREPPAREPPAREPPANPTGAE